LVACWVACKDEWTKEKALRARTSDTSDCAGPKWHAPQISRGCGVYQALVASGIFNRTNPDVVWAFSQQLEPERFPVGGVVDPYSDRGGRLYVIISGKVKVSLRRPGGCEVVLTVRGPGEIFGAITLFGRHSKEVWAAALTEVLAVPIERGQLLGWMAQRPEVRDQVLRLFARWTKTMTDSLVDFAFADVETRLARRLLCLMKRFGRREGDEVQVEHDLTLDDFSLIVGAAPETIWAALRDFENRGWIRLQDSSFAIVDAQALASVRPMSVEACRV
jgi:CRP/FNR family transcriptional regulator, cyclic AMP receptor protein